MLRVYFLILEGTQPVVHLEDEIGIGLIFGLHVGLGIRSGELGHRREALVGAPTRLIGWQGLVDEFQLPRRRLKSLAAHHGKQRFACVTIGGFIVQAGRFAIVALLAARK